MPARVAVLLNPLAGHGRALDLAPRIVDAFAGHGVEADLLVGADRAQAQDLAAKAVAEGLDALVAFGGDGSINTALQAVALTGTPLGIIPLGTGNDNARLLGLPRKDPVAAVGIICRFLPRTVDVASVRTADGVEQFFLGVLSAGFDSNVTERANALTWPPGPLKYVRALVQELRAFRAVDFTITVDGEVLRDRAMFAAVGNGVTYGGGMQVCAGALVDDGLLTITWAHESSMRHFLANFPKVYRGTHLADPGVTQHVGRRVRIEAAGQLAYADGDRMGPLPIDVQVHPDGLQVLTATGQ